MVIEPPTHRYRYKKLETERTIRLVTILPGSISDDIHLEIQHRHLDHEAPAYEALSYVWGVSDSCGEVFISNVAVDVTPNLFDALRCLRYGDKSRIMWIDAIAIKQEDLAEKSTQLPLMRFIYPRAAATVVYVGDADEDTAWAFNCFELLHGMYSFWYDNPKAATQRGLRSRVIRFDLQRLFQFLRREWFERAWTFQEICLSGEVQVICGKHSVGWHTIVFAIAAARMGSDGAGLAGVEERAQTRFEYWALLHLVGKSEAQRQFSMTTLLSETRGLATTNHRDRIYSLMGLANVGRIVLRPDYTLSVASTYIHTTRYLIVDDNGLSVFQQLDRPEDIDDLPSWVPDWRQTQRGLTLVPSKTPSWLPDKSKKMASSSTTTGKFYNFNASHTVDFTDRLISDKPKLFLTGACVDVIETVHPTRNLMQRLLELNKDANISWRRVFSEIRGFVDNVASLCPSSYAEEDPSIAILRTLCADRLPISQQRETSTDMIPEQLGHYKRNTGTALFRTKTFVFDAAWIKQKYICMWSEASQQPDVPSALATIASRTIHAARMVTGIQPGEDEDEKRSRIAREYCTVVCGVLDGRTFITTHQGRIGLAPDKCQAGDQIFSLLGGDVPYVLRPTAKASEYKILGEAYVHGVMDGELWSLGDDGGGLRARRGDVTFGNVVLV